MESQPAVPKPRKFRDLPEEKKKQMIENAKKS